MSLISYSGNHLRGEKLVLDVEKSFCKEAQPMAIKDDNTEE